MKIIFIFSFFVSGVVAQNNIDFIGKVQIYQDSIRLIKQEECPDLIDTLTFDIDFYFKLFDKLSLPTDSKIRYIFIDEKTGGAPILYIIKDSINLENYMEMEFEEYVRRHQLDKSEITQEFIDFKKYEILCGFASVNNARKFVIPEDNESGYLQFLFFYHFGEDFALKWHANYGKKSVIFSNDEIKRLYNYYLETDLFYCDLTKFEKLLKLNPTPIIIMKENSCIVTWYEIYTHHGIYKRTYEISRYSPYKIDKKEDIEILKINANFIY